MKGSVPSIRGGLVAGILQTSWRAGADQSISISLSQLDEITPLLYGSGAAGLGWWRIRESDLRNSPSGKLLHQAFRLQALFAKMQETKVQSVFRLLRAAGIEPILIKGWAIAHLYPRPGLRPSGDIDLLLKPQDYRLADRLLKNKEHRDHWVDLHGPSLELADRSIDDLFSRSHLEACGTEQVRVLCAEDHLALVAVHLLKHGAWRPLWLCDVALLLETMPSDFDWELCLGDRRANWILSAVGLAHLLLDAEINDREIDARARQIPLWLGRRVLAEWEAPFTAEHAPLNHRAPMSNYLHDPRGVLSDLVRRWPSPITATINLKGSFNNFPRIPYQLGDLVTRGARFLYLLPQLWLHRVEVEH